MPIQAYDAGWFAGTMWCRSYFNDDFHLRAIRFDFSILELQVLLHNLRDPEGPRNIFPALSIAAFAAFSQPLGARADQLNDFVNGFSHDLLLCTSCCSSISSALLNSRVACARGKDYWYGKP